MTRLINMLITDKNHDIAKALYEMMEVFLIGTFCLGAAPLLMWLAATSWSI